LTIAEVFLSEPILDLPGMLNYVTFGNNKTGAGSKNNRMDNLLHEDSPAVATLNKIDDEEIKVLVADMTQRNPLTRRTVGGYRSILEKNGRFPTYFGGVLYDLYTKLHLHSETPEDRIKMVCQVLFPYFDMILLSS